MNNTSRHQATPRHCAILAISLLFLIAALTGSAHLFAGGASDRYGSAKGAVRWQS